MNDEVMNLLRLHFNFLMKYPDKEDLIFNVFGGFIDIVAFCYAELVKTKKILRLEELPDDAKKELKLEAKRIDPNCSTEKGMKICKTVYVFGWLSNQ